MKEAASIMRRKVLLENAMPTTAQNGNMAEEALSEAVGGVIPGMHASQIPNYSTCCKTLRNITTTVRGIFKAKARHEVPHYYHLTLPMSDVEDEIEHKRNIVPTLIKDRAYLFVSHCPVSHSLTDVHVSRTSQMVRVCSPQSTIPPSWRPSSLLCLGVNFTLPLIWTTLILSIICFQLAVLRYTQVSWSITKEYMKPCHFQLPQHLQESIGLSSSTILWLTTLLLRITPLHL
jgi:hypothetical protein